MGKIDVLGHYSLENPASVYDEEALTALELAGRTAKKVSECVTTINRIDADVTERIEDHEVYTQNVLDKGIASIPAQVEKCVEDHLVNGDFDAQIEEHLGNLDDRLDNIIKSEGDNNLEIVDARVNFHGFEHATMGDAVRNEVGDAVMGSQGVCNFYPGSINADDGDFYQETTNRIVSSLIPKDKLVYVTVNDPYLHFRVFYYDETTGYLGASSWSTFMLMDKLPANVYYVRFVYCYTDDRDILPQDLNMDACIVSKKALEVYKRTSKIPTINGSVNSSGQIVYYENRLLSPILPASFRLAYPLGNYFLLVACYDKDMKWLGNTEFTDEVVQWGVLPTGTEYVRYVVRALDNVAMVPLEDAFVIYGPDHEMYHDWNQNEPPFVHDMMHIAYSDMGLLCPNTNWHYDLVSHMGFNAIKGDVRITRDGVLIMSHDAGYTLTADGEITAYDSTNSYLWSEKDYAEIKDLRYADLSEFHTKFRPQVCTFEMYLQVCVKEHKIAYITLRNVNIPEVVAKVFDTLKKYDMVDRCVINSYTLQTLETVRLYSRSVPVSMVTNHLVDVTMADVVKVQSLGNSILTLFYWPNENASVDEVLSPTLDVINYARDNGVIIHGAQINSWGVYREAVRAGIKGFHLLRDVCGYAPKMYRMKLTVENGAYKSWTQVDKHLPYLDEEFSPDVTGSDANFILIGTHNQRMKVRLCRLPATVTVYKDINTNVPAIVREDGYIYINHGGVDGDYIVNILV